MIIKGIAVSSGISIGPAKVLKPLNCRLDYHLLPQSKLKQECRHLEKALNKLTKQIKASAKHLCQASEHYQLIEADLILLEDEELKTELTTLIIKQQFSAALAVEHAFAKQAQVMREMNSSYLSSRADDVLCLSQRLISLLLTGESVQLSELPNNCIVIAKDITPAEFATLPLDKVAGLVLQTGGITSHTAILARAASIPTLMNCPCELSQIDEGTLVAINALQGELIINPIPEQVSKLNQQQQQLIDQKDKLEKFKHQISATQDGHHVTLFANVGSISEINQLTSIGAEGVGLFRTEFIFMNSATLPTEEEQYQLYYTALKQLNGKVLTIRTIDLGADKELTSLNLPAEENPALGVRGIRYTLTHLELFKSQLQAILRAANHGPIRLMFPMVNQIEELDATLALIEQCKAQLIEAEQGFGEIELGIVVETPAAVINLESMLPLLDFISIGTNDLTQYTMAADRANPYLINQYPVISPAMVKLIAQAIKSAKQQNITVSVCGELASEPLATPLLIGLGVDELSTSTASLLEIKQTLSQWRYPDCVTLAEKAIVTTRISELNELLSQYHS